MSTSTNSPRFPIYIPSKGRADVQKTSPILTRMGVRHNIIVEPHEVDAYRRELAGSLATVIPLDMAYKSRYELCDNIGLAKSTGSGPARNFAWDHSIASGHAWHWIMDDNIKGFMRVNRNARSYMNTPVFFRAQEDFVLRYTNVAMAGPCYMMFVPVRQRTNPYCLNTRIFSCNLIRNDVPFRWRGRYNEDAILSLDLLKAGWCTVQFKAFQQWKMRTQTLKGGNTSELYAQGTEAKSVMLKRVHPDVVKLVWRYGRHHHHLDYSGFKQVLLRRPDLVMEHSDYAMKLVPRSRRA